jgi:hypothetical protein
MVVEQRSPVIAREMRDYGEIFRGDRTVAGITRSGREFDRSFACLLRRRQVSAQQKRDTDVGLSLRFLMTKARMRREVSILLEKLGGRDGVLLREGELPKGVSRLDFDHECAGGMRPFERYFCPFASARVIALLVPELGQLCFHVGDFGRPDAAFGGTAGSQAMGGFQRFLRCIELACDREQVADPACGGGILRLRCAHESRVHECRPICAGDAIEIGELLANDERNFAVTRINQQLEKCGGLGVRVTRSKRSGCSDRQVGGADEIARGNRVAHGLLEIEARDTNIDAALMKGVLLS